MPYHWPRAPVCCWICRMFLLIPPLPLDPLIKVGGGRGGLLALRRWSPGLRSGNVHIIVPYRWPRAPVCHWICQGIHSYHRVTGSMMPAMTSYRQKVGSMVPATTSYRRGMGSMVPAMTSYRPGMGSMMPAMTSYRRGIGSMVQAMTSYRRGMFCFPITQGWAAVRNSQVRRVLRVRSCSDPTIAGIRGSSCQKVVKDARGFLVRRQNIVKSDKLSRDTKDMLIVGKDARGPIT